MHHLCGWTFLQSLESFLPPLLFGAASAAGAEAERKAVEVAIRQPLCSLYQKMQVLCIFPFFLSFPRGDSSLSDICRIVFPEL